MNRLQEIAEKLPDVFTPSAPVSDVRLLRGRERVLEDIANAMARRGASIVLYGERGVGKSSVAKIRVQFTQGQPYYYSASAEDTFESILASVLQFYNVGWVPDSVEKSTATGAQVGLQLQSSSLGASITSSDQERQAQLEKARLTPQQVAARLPGAATLIVIDEFERLVQARDRAMFADLIKKLSDNDSRTTLMLVGIGENIDELLGAHESAHRSIVEVRVDRLTNEEITEIVDTGMDTLGLTIDPSVREQIVIFSARFPYYTHLLCEGVVRSLLNREFATQSGDLRVLPADLTYSIGHAIRNAQRSIISNYEDAIRSIKGTPRFKYVLYAIASWPQEPVGYGDICRWVGKLQHAPNGSVNVSHQLDRLESLKVIKRSAKGFYAFTNPMLKAYVILKARADSPEAELRTIDALLEEVSKRIGRVRERIGTGNA